MSFQIHALPAETFTPLFDLPEEALAARLARRMTADARPGFPCRVSLEDAQIGERVLLVNHVHLPEGTPYRASHAVFVRQGAVQAFPEADEIPDFLLSRLISVRAFDDAHMMVRADAVEGSSLALVIPEMLRDARIACLHLHNARQGCYMARVTRA